MRIPALPELGVLQAEGTGEIEHSRAPLRQQRRHFGRERLRDRQEHGIQTVAQPVEVERLGWLIPDGAERWNAPGLRTLRSHGDFEFSFRVAGEPAEELDPGIAGGPCDAYPDATVLIHRNE